MRNMINCALKNELAGWKPQEAAWLAVATLVIVGLSIYWGDTLMGIISSTTGVICVVCTGKGKLSAYGFGLINSILYAIIAFGARLYGETMLNALYYVPMQFIGFYIWRKNMNEETHEVRKLHMNWNRRGLLFAVIAVCTVAYGFVLRALGDVMPFVDSFTTVSSVFAMIVSVRMFAEQWWIWVAVDVFSVYMWYCDFRTGSGNIATLLMWAIYLGNAIIMLIRWEKKAHESSANRMQNII